MLVLPRLTPLGLASSLLVALTATGACHVEEPAGNEADMVGVAAQCDVDDDCLFEPDTGGEPFDLQCLTTFKGGYCGVVDCTAHVDCPEGSACVAHDDGVNYCFRLCVDKAECNLHRSPDQEANCSSNVDYVGPDAGKACVPPEGA